MINLLRPLATFSALLLLLGSCFPYFEPHPHNDAYKFLGKPEIALDDIVELIGPPDFELAESSFVWVDPRIDGGGLQWVYILSVDVDSSGKVIHYEKDKQPSGWDYCLHNGICFTKQMFEVPLAPSQRDLGAKKFKADPNACTVYLYRDSERVHASKNNYAHMSLKANLLNQAGGKAQEIHYSAVSAPGGFSYWTIPTPAHIQVESNYGLPLEYDFRCVSCGWGAVIYDLKRPADSFEFQCVKNDIKYLRLFLPDGRKYSSELNLVTSKQAHETILNLHLILDFYQGSEIGNTHH